MFLQPRPFRILRQGSWGADVQNLQVSLLAAGLNPGRSDSGYGPSTDAAVRKFQHARGLRQDGVLGPKTSAELSYLTGSGAQRSAATGLSLHIGLNTVDTRAYRSNVPQLAGCINDAHDMRDLATSKGFSTKLLIDATATADAVMSAIRNAAQVLGPGDLFLLTYSGHGSQMIDPTGEEPDRFNETWVLWDRQLLDDELYGLWGSFEPGVRVVVISDSCHSGSMTRGWLDLSAFGADANRDQTGASTQNQPIGSDHHDPHARQSSQRAVGVALVQREVTDPIIEGVPRLLPPDQATDDSIRRSERYRNAKVSAQQSALPRCAVLLISGCQDNQTSSDGAPSEHQNGAFTEALLSEWKAAQDYPDLRNRTLKHLSRSQVPNLYWATPRDVTLESQQPFAI